MTAAAIAAAAIFAYPLAAAVLLVRAGRRIDTTFARDMHRVLRSRDRASGHGSDTADRAHPQLSLSAMAGVERGGHPHTTAAPPAPCPLAGVAVPRPTAPARATRVMVHG